MSGSRRLRLPVAPLPLAGLAALGVASAAIWSRSLGTRANFDEGGYTLALRTLEAGQELGEDIYLAQPPLFYHVLQGISLVTGSTFDGLRLGMIGISLLALVAAFALGRAFAGDGGGLAAAALLAALPPFPANAPLIEADPPSVAFALVALALAAHGYGRDRHGALALLAGAALAVSILIKLFTVTAFAPLLALALWRRATRRQLLLTVAGGVAATVLVLLPHVDALPEVWEGAVAGHLEQREIEAPSHGDNAQRVLEFLHPRAPASYFVLAAVALAVLRPTRGAWTLWTWTAAAVAFTIAMRPLLDHHLVLLAAALAVPAGVAAVGGSDVLRRGGRVAAGALGALLLAAGLAQQYTQLEENNRPEDGRTLWAVEVVRAETHEDELIVTDIPTVAVLAEREVPGFTVDVSWGRVVSGSLNARNLLSTVRQHRVGAVVVGRMLRVSPGVAEALGREFPARVQRDGVTVYYR